MVEMRFTNVKTLYRFTSSLFDREDRAWKAAKVIQGILRARSSGSPSSPGHPFWFLVFSSRTVQNPGRVIGSDRPVPFPNEAGAHFVARLSTARHPAFTDEHGQKRRLFLAPGEEVFLLGLRYKGEVEVNVAGVWEPRHPEPLSPKKPSPFTASGWRSRRVTGTSKLFWALSGR